MKKIIVFPGRMDGTFFKNEIDEIAKHFDEVVVISYPGNSKIFDDLATVKKINYYALKTKIRAIFTLAFVRWIFERDTLAEIKTKVRLSRQGLRRLGYLIFYGLFYLEAKKVVDQELSQSGDIKICLYSFWLSRAAYVISRYNMNRKSNVVKIISRAHGYDLYENRAVDNYLPFRKYINNNLDEIGFISSHGLNYHQRMYLDFAGNRYVSRLGTYNTNELRKPVFLKNTVCIASCSSVTKVKRIDLIIDLMSKIDIEFRWIHIGDGTLLSGMEKEARKKLDVMNYEFLGRIDNKKILEIYLDYDVDFLINMSDSEGVPVSMMEAMSLGIPVIARNVGGIPEIVSEETGLLIENISDMEKVAKLMTSELEKRISDVQYYKQKSETCIKKWKLMYNATTNYSKFFSTILGKNPS